MRTQGRHRTKDVKDEGAPRAPGPREESLPLLWSSPSAGLAVAAPSREGTPAWRPSQPLRVYHRVTALGTLGNLRNLVAQHFRFIEKTEAQKGA